MIVIITFLMYLKHCPAQTGVSTFFLNYLRRFRPLYLALLLLMLYLDFFEKKL